MSNTVLFGKVKDPELMVYNFRGQLQCRMGGKQEGPIKTYPKFWNWNPLTASGQEILRIPVWKKSFELVKRELEAILEKEIFPTTVPELSTVRRTTLGMNSSLVVLSLFVRAAAEGQQREFTDGWDPLFIGYTAAVYFHTCDIKINSWTTQAKKMIGSLPPKFEIREILRKLERAGSENMLPVWDDGRMIVAEGHIALKDEMKFAGNLKIPGTLRTGTGGYEAGGERAGCSRPVVCGSDGIQETGSNDTITPDGWHP